MIAAEFPGRSKGQQPPVKESFLAEKAAFHIKKFGFSEKEIQLLREKVGFSAANMAFQPVLQWGCLKGLNFEMTLSKPFIEFYCTSAHFVQFCYS